MAATCSVPSTTRIGNLANKLGTGIAGLAMLKQQLSVYEDIFKDVGAKCTELISAQQKEINREFLPIIAIAMTPAYNFCTTERGPGQFVRMKSFMREHIDQKRSTMFKDATEEVRKRLRRMITEIEGIMADRTDEISVSISRDY